MQLRTTTPYLQMFVLQP